MTLSLRIEDPPPPAADPQSFREAMRHLSGGVSVVTVGRGADRSGLVATSVSSLAVDPPTLIVSVNKQSSTWPLLARHRAFGVNILAAGQRAIAERFSGRGGIKGAARYAEGRWITLATGTQLLADALAAVDCELEELIDRHSHSIVLGRVRAVLVAGGDAPLIYWRGGYGAFRGPDPLA